MSNWLYRHPCSHIFKPDSLPGALDLMLFRDGVKPMWEDENNARGGKLSFKFKKNTAGNVVWEETVCGMLDVA
jgi:translation initiation factor 4E